MLLGLFNVLKLCFQLLYFYNFYIFKELFVRIIYLGLSIFQNLRFMKSCSLAR